MDKRYLTGTIFLTLAVVVAVVFVDDKYREMVLVSETLKNKEKEFEGQRVLVNEIDKINKEFAPVLGEIRKVDKFLPKNKNVADLLVQMDFITARNGLLINDISFPETSLNKAGASGKGVVPAGNKFYDSLELKLSLSGSYNSFLGFSNDIKSNSHLMDIVLFDVKKADEPVSLEESDVVKDSVLVFNVTIEAYYQK